MSENQSNSNDTQEPIYSATKYVEYHVTFMSAVDEDIEI
jgi:hypothetical protein